jgi:hypothetical protein
MTWQTTKELLNYKDLEGSGYGLIKVLFPNLPARTQENHEDPLVKTETLN